MITPKDIVCSILVLVGTSLAVAQSKQALPEDSLSSSARALLIPYKQLRALTMTGTVKSEGITGRFTITMNKDEYKLLLPDGLGETEEQAWNRHGGMTCKVSLREQVVSSSSYDICGFPVPWFFPLTMLPELHTKAYKLIGSRESNSVVLTVSPTGFAAATSGHPTAMLRLEPASGQLSEYAFATPDLKRPGYESRFAVTYSDYRQVDGLTYPFSIRRKAESGESLELVVESIEVRK